MAINDAEKANFGTLKRAFDDGNAALVETKEKATGRRVVLICGMGFDDGEYQISPFAELCDGDPFEKYIDPVECLDADEKTEKEKGDPAARLGSDPQG